MGSSFLCGTYQLICFNEFSHLLPLVNYKGFSYPYLSSQDKVYYLSVHAALNMEYVPVVSLRIHMLNGVAQIIQMKYLRKFFSPLQVSSLPAVLLHK